MQFVPHSSGRSEKRGQVGPTAFPPRITSEGLQQSQLAGNFHMGLGFILKNFALYGSQPLQKPGLNFSFIHKSGCNPLLC